MSQMDYVQVMVKKQLSIDDTPEQQTSHQSSSLVMKPHLQQELHLNLHKSPHSIICMNLQKIRKYNILGFIYDKSNYSG